MEQDGEEGEEEMVGVGIDTVAYVALSFGTGYVMGLALKKAASLVLTVAGLYMLSLVTLANFGVLTINWGALADLVRKVTGMALDPLMSAGVLTLPVLAGMVSGLIFSRCAYCRREHWVRG